MMEFWVPWWKPKDGLYEITCDDDKIKCHGGHAHILWSHGSKAQRFSFYQSWWNFGRDVWTWSISFGECQIERDVTKGQRSNSEASSCDPRSRQSTTANWWLWRLQRCLPTDSSEIYGGWCADEADGFSSVDGIANFWNFGGSQWKYPPPWSVCHRSMRLKRAIGTWMTTGWPNSMTKTRRMSTPFGGLLYVCIFQTWSDSFSGFGGPERTSFGDRRSAFQGPEWWNTFLCHDRCNIACFGFGTFCDAFWKSNLWIDEW